MEENDDIKKMVYTDEKGVKHVSAYNVTIQEKAYKIQLFLLIATIILAVLMIIALWKFFPFLLKIDEGNWLSRFLLTCRECAPCV